jgi:hypothetical protein
VELIEDVIFISGRIVHGCARVVQPASRCVDVAVRSPASEEGVVAHGTDLVGVDGQALAVTTITSVSCARATGDAARRAAPREVSDFIIFAVLGEEEDGDGVIDLP